MSTPDTKGAAGLPLPGELNLVATQLPRTGDTATLPTAMASSTPGASLAGARVVTAPTLPDFDPVSLTRVVSDLANALFSAPPGPASPSDTSSLTPTSTGGAPAISAAPSPPVEPPASPAAAAPSASLTPQSSDLRSPFDGPLNFDAIAQPVDPFAALDAETLSSLSLIDLQSQHPSTHGSPGSNPAIATAVAHHTPTHDQPREQRREPTELRFDTFEIAPTHDLSVRSLGGTPFDANALRREFPILHKPVRGKRLVWLDNAATTQKPQAVIDRLSYFYENENSNIHRAAHTLAARATDAYESARESVRRFINAPSVKDIVFVRGTTEGINFIAQSWGRRNVQSGDEILISWLEHHANIVPWQQLCLETGAKLRVAPVDSRGQILLEEYQKLLGPKTKLVSFTQVSNALGTITPAQEMIDMAHRHGAVVLLDGAQGVSHMPVDVQMLGCDFFVLSGHKVFGPTGIGAVFGKSEILESMPPWQGGGNMIQDVTFERTVYQPPPARFEAGTGNIADAVGLGAALDWLSRVGVERVERYEHELLEYATPRLLDVPGLTMIGTALKKAGVLSFVLAGQKTEEVGGLLDQDGIAVRSGHHCAQPILRRFGLEATVRASLAPYNTFEDIDALVAALHRLQAGRDARVKS